ncbi:MAG: hypothetical protein WCS27_13775 [Victivallaceae bacterium]
MGFIVILHKGWLKNEDEENKEKKEECFLAPFSRCYQQESSQDDYNFGDPSELNGEYYDFINLLITIEDIVGIKQYENKGSNPANQQREIVNAKKQSMVLNHGQLSFTTLRGDDKVEHIQTGNVLTYFWTESWNEDQFLGISCISQSLADYISIVDESVFKNHAYKPSIEECEEQPVNNNENRSFSSCTTSSIDQLHTIESSISVPTSVNEKSYSTKTGDIKSSEHFLTHSTLEFRNSHLWNKQKELWSQRAVRDERHIRVALCQFDVGWTSYFHIIENDEKVKSEEYKIKKDDADFQEEKSKRLLNKALEICKCFNVDLLLLPEYSIRPQTIAYLIERLATLKSKLLIWAGTFRNPNDTSIYDSLKINFELGESLFKTPYGSPLCIISKDGVTNVRLKKYPAVALKEDFCPYDDEIRPLFIENNHCGQFVLELICSEIFMATSPANINAITRAHYNLFAKHFLYPPGGDLNTYLEKVVVTDLKNFADAVGLSSNPVDKNKEFKPEPRRTILFIPAATTRASDFHAMGKANFLAAGLCTVFCNGISSEKKCKAAPHGGSCFIGNGSTFENNSYMHTPYCGFAPGILISPHGNPLDKNEEALVIADIDPYYMCEGRPRPQMLPVPLNLVAHIPFIYTTKKIENSWPPIHNFIESNFNKRHQDLEYRKLKDEIEILIKDLHFTLKISDECSNLFRRLEYLKNEMHGILSQPIPAALYDYCFIERNHS